MSTEIYAWIGFGGMVILFAIMVWINRQQGRTLDRAIAEWSETLDMLEKANALSEKLIARDKP